MNKEKLQKLIVTSLLVAVSFVVGMIEIPWSLGFIPSLKIDLSDIILVVCLLAIGYKQSIICLLIRNVLNILIFRLASQFGPLGGLYEEFIAFVASFSFITLVYLFFKIFKVDNLRTKSSYFKFIWIVVIISSIMGIWMTFFNFIFSTPFYVSGFLIPTFTDIEIPIYFEPFSMVKDNDIIGYFVAMKIDDLNISSFIYFCVATYLPFNLVKYVLVAVLGITVAILVKPFLRKYFQKDETEITPEIKESKAN